MTITKECAPTAGTGEAREIRQDGAESRASLPPHGSVAEVERAASLLHGYSPSGVAHAARWFALGWEMGERAHEALQGTCGDGYDTGYAEGWQAGYEAGSLVRLDRWAGDWREAGASIVGGIQAVESRRRAAERADLDAQSWDADTELARCAASWGIFEGAGA